MDLDVTVDVSDFVIYIVPSMGASDSVIGYTKDGWIMFCNEVTAHKNIHDACIRLQKLGAEVT